MAETLKKRTDIGGDVKETDKSTWRSESNRQILVETLKKQTNIETLKKPTNIGGDRQILVETLKKQTNIGDVKVTDKYFWRR